MTSGDRAGRGAQSRTARRRTGRLVAVQALYQLEMAGGTVDAVITDFMQRGVIIDGNGDAPKADYPLFATILRGAVERREEIDALLAAHLGEGWRIGRLDVTLAAILRAAICELLTSGDGDRAPARVVINEYVEIAHAFYDGPEPGLVNGLLDRCAHLLRPEEFGGEAGQGERPTR